MKRSQALQQIPPSYIREILSESKQPGVISLAGGLPATELLPVRLFDKAIQSLTQTPELFQYGETQGYAPLLDYIQKQYTVDTHTSLVCNGSQQALDLIARAFINPGDKVVVEAPSYLGALQVFGLAEANILSTPQTHTGPDIEQLELLFSSQDVLFFYGVPDFHNPTGVCWSLEKRQQVAELCQRYDVFFIEDAPYRELRFSGEPLPLVSLFCPEHSVVLRSFSKISVPGIRLGVASAPDDFIQAMIRVKQASDLHTSLPMQATLLNVLNDKEFSQHVLQVCQAYKSRYETIRTLLQPLNTLGCHFNEIEGGMFIWLSLPDIDAMALAKALLREKVKEKVAVVPSSVFYHSKAIATPALRLNFTYCSTKELAIAIETLFDTLVSFGPKTRAANSEKN